jgi:hypothetical protein
MRIAGATLRTLGVVLLLMIGTAVQAASRIVVKTTEPVLLYLDGMPVQAAGGSLRTSIPHVEAGSHTLAVHGLDGQPLHAEVLQFGDGANVVVQWMRGAQFTVTGATATPAAGSVDYSQDTPTGVGGVNSMGASSSGSTGASGNPTRIVSAAASGGVRSLTTGARAGNSFGPDQPYRQTIVKANVVYGNVVFIKRSGPGVRVYDQGMLVAEMEPGEATAKARIEVGRRTFEFRGVPNHELWYIGDLQLDQSHTVQLAFDDVSTPLPQVRPWLWQSH